MADSPFRRDQSRPAPLRQLARDKAQPAPAISCRATNPLSLNDDLGKVFLDEDQAKATTATRLFRDPKLFNALAKTVLPDFFSKNAAAKFCVWSTGCSSGEEVYSLTMIAINEFDRVKRAVNIDAFGTDINRNRIAEARAGTYTRPSMDSLTQEYLRLLNNDAQMTSREVIMGPRLKSICKFTLFDMRNCPKKHTFHFIVCNHVMQYYDADGQRHIIANLKSVLKPGGFLYLEGVTENGLAGSGLKKVATVQNLYFPENPSSGLNSPLFRKR